MENQTSPSKTSIGVSSSSTAADPNNSCSNIFYDVFINHRGEVKKTLASHLYRGLLSRGLRPFLDQPELQKGVNFPSQLEAAIRSASVHIAIFSPNYAESRWCLDELLLMQETGAPIIPIFYHVNPAEVRWTDETKTGVYAQALNKPKMKSRYDSATIQNWRDALSRVADISGFDLDGTLNGDEGEMLEKIVECVVKMSKKPRLYVAKHPTGLNEKVADFEASILKQQQRSGNVQIVGIVGLGGVGKTTLSIELFNRNRSNYSKSYFLSDVREKAHKNSLHSLQSELLKGLTQLDLHINNINEGIGILERHLKASHVFIILDDVDHEDQLEAFLPVKDVLSWDSLILITSRDRDVLARSGVEELSIYKLTGLPTQHSRELFCSYAFHQPYPLEEFEDIVDKFLKECVGLPLSLKILGALLYGNNDRSFWENILYQVKVPTDIQKRLKISYDALSGEEQHIFLDIACFFIGEKKSSAITLWDGSGWNGSLGFKNLEGKCLVEVDTENIIHMHDHLRDMGRDIGEEKLPGRLWRPIENIDNWLHQQSSVIIEARGISIPHTDSSDKSIKTNLSMLSWYQTKMEKVLGNRMMNLLYTLYRFLGIQNRVMEFLYPCYRFLGVGVDAMKLQLLSTEGYLLERILRRVYSPNLIWLSWSDCPYSYLPSWIPMTNLRVLRVQGRLLETLWQDKSQPPNSFGNFMNLYHMDLSGCEKLERLPDSLCTLTKLRHVDLSGCEKLERLPDSFGSLTNLHHLDLSGCRKLERLPNSFGSLMNLHFLGLSVCEKLMRLPDSFGSLTNLYRLDLSWCTKLEGLPDSLGRLRSLHCMDLFGCRRLERLPDSLGSLMNLHRMDLSGCWKLKMLPDSLGSLMNLQHMSLSECGELERLPDSLGGLRNLQHICLFACKKLESLPDSFGSLSNLKYLDFSSCSNLAISSDTLGNITTLEHVDFSRCEKIEVWLSKLAHQRSLKTLKLIGTNLKELPSEIGVLSNLEVLWIGSPSLDTLPPSLGDLKDLKELSLSDCRELQCLPASVARLIQLTKLEVAGCSAIKLPFKGQREIVETLKSEYSLHKYMSPLQYLLLAYTEVSEVSFDEGVCPNLQHFILRACSNLVKVGTLPNTLTKVEVSCCFNMRNMEGLDGLTKLQALDILQCHELQELPSVKTLVPLRWLRAIDCVKLKNIQDLGHLTKLQSLDVSGCLELHELEGVENCISLRYLDASRCKELQELPSIKTLASLEHLKAVDCVKLKSIRDLGHLTKLSYLDVGGCLELEELKEVEHCKGLTFLYASRCPKLQWGEGLLERLRQSITIWV